MAVSPGTQIKNNAAAFGIPLNLQCRPGELVAPVPVRVAPGGAIVMPSPTASSMTIKQAAFAGYAAPVVAGAAQSVISAPQDCGASFVTMQTAGPAAPTQVAQAPALLRHIVTPFSAGRMQARKAQGGA